MKFVWRLFTYVSVTVTSNISSQIYQITLVYSQITKLQGTKVTPASIASKIWHTFKKTPNALVLKSPLRIELASACNVREGSCVCKKLLIEPWYRTLIAQNSLHLLLQAGLGLITLDFFLWSHSFHYSL